MPAAAAAVYGSFYFCFFYIFFRRTVQNMNDECSMYVSVCAVCYAVHACPYACALDCDYSSECVLFYFSARCDKHSFGSKRAKTFNLDIQMCVRARDRAFLNSISLRYVVLKFSVRFGSVWFEMNERTLSQNKGRRFGYKVKTENHNNTCTSAPIWQFLVPFDLAEQTDFDASHRNIRIFMSIEHT